MSDWKFLEANRVRVPTPRVLEQYCSTQADGFNGMFRFVLSGRQIRCLASDGMGWQHVSVSIEGETQPPRWYVMCKIKDLFWEPEDWVCQFHPAQSQYVNMHSGCLHLWRPTAEKMPTPDAYMVGLKGVKLRV